MDVISIIGVLSRNKVRVKSVARIATYVNLDGKNRLPMTAELLDRRGKVLATAPVYKLPQTASGCDCPSCGDQTEPDTFAIHAFFDFSAHIPAVAFLLGITLGAGFASVRKPLAGNRRRRSKGAW